MTRRADIRRAMPAFRSMARLAAYFRANPQVFVLLVICVVLGLGTFIAVLIALASSGSTTTGGEPSGAILAMQALFG